MIEANEKGEIILERMQADIRIRKAEMPKPNRDGFSGIFNYPSKTTTDQVVIQKVRTEANVSRAKVPPDMRAEPYDDEDSKASKPESGFSSHFKTAGQSAAEDSSPKMSSAFNRASETRNPEAEVNTAVPQAKI